MAKKKMHIMFALYIIFLIWAIMWKCRMPSIGCSEYIINGSSERIINLIPFKDNAGYEKYFNFLLFVPLGFYLSAIWEKSDVVKRLFIIAATSLAFEILQFALAVGRSDITDLILNTFGGAVGIGVFALTVRLFGKYQGKAVITVCTAITAVVLYFSVSFIALGYVHIGRLIFRL